MTKIVHVTYCGLDGEGRTVTDAKQDAARKLATLVSDLEGEPVVIAFRGQAKLVYRSRYGWAEMLLTNDHGTVENGRHSVCYGAESREAVIRSAAMHVASLAWSHDVADDETFARDALGQHLRGVELAEAVSELLRGWKFHRAYREARQAGYDDNDARHIAGGLGHLVKAAAGIGSAAQ